MKAHRLITAARPDETLYSAAARAWRYLGQPKPGLMHRAVFGLDLAVPDSDLPVGLDAGARSAAFGKADLGDVLHEMTAFAYYAHFVAPARVDVAVRAMAGTGRWAHEALGSWTAFAPPPNGLRFCLRCREDMLDQHPDLWWRRVHQVPSVLVCPSHGDPLHESGAGRGQRTGSYVPASLALCETRSPRIVGQVAPRVMMDLLVLARANEALLDREFGTHRDDVRMEYLRRLRTLGLLNRAGEADLAKLARALEGYWGIRSISGRC